MRKNKQEPEKQEDLLIIITGMSVDKFIVHTFKGNDFKPPFLFSNNHFQTIVGSGAIKSKILGQVDRPFNTTSERINTPDGDFFDVEFTENVEQTTSMVLLLHGLESNTRSHTITNFANAFLEKGYSCCLVSFRACNGEDNRTKHSYHLGWTKDMHQLTNILHKRYPDKKFYLSGFSLGGNVILKLLGELGEDAAKLNIAGAAVTCVPFDPVSSQGKLDTGFNRWAYSETFLATMKQKAEAHNLAYPGLFDIEAVRRCDKIGDFDELFIAKVYGFKNKIDYYRQSGAKWWLNKIRVPVIAVNARDDPFIEEASLPTEEDVGEAPVRLIYHDRGGHCGFYTTVSGDPNITDEDLKRDPLAAAVKPHGWLAEEMSRAVHHINVSKTNATK